VKGITQHELPVTRNQKGQNNKRLTKNTEFMKNRNNVITTLLLALGVLGLSPIAQAVNPAPDGGYSNLTTAEGQNALQSLTSGAANTALGAYSLFSTTTASFDTAVGAGALDLNITGDANTAVGAAALLLNTGGTQNTALGAAALESNDTGQDNTATGALALFNNTIGGGNTANGALALFHNAIGLYNTATGGQALFSNTGSGNTANGAAALIGNTIGNNNTAIGRGTLSVTTGDGNTALGANAGNALTTGVNNIDIGVDVIGVAGESNTIRIGANLPETPGASACHIGGIYNQLVDPATASSMAIDVTGKLGTSVSSRRFKHDIKPMDKASEAILALKPVTFHYKSDAKNTPCFGLIAEEVAGVNPDLVVRNKNGEIWSVRYDQVNAMLLNEFLKEHKKVQDLETTVAQQQKGMEILTAQLKEQAAQILKIGAQVEVSKSVPQAVANEP
jgi:Chaperone of endosialidase